MGIKFVPLFWPQLNGEGDVLLINRVRTTSGGACEPLCYKATKASMTANPSGQASVTGYSQSARIFNSSELSTRDTGGSSSCVTGQQGIPWFYGSCCTTCPTYKGSYWNDEPHPMQSYTHSTADIFGNTETEVCGANVVKMSDNGSTYRGTDSMEFFVR